MALRILFWLAVALDVAAMLLFFLLGLAAAGPSKTNPLIVVWWMLVLPGLFLVAAIAVFVFVKSPFGRVAAFLLVASPIILAGGSWAWAQYDFTRSMDPSGNLSAFGGDGGMREVERAIWSNDGAAAERALAKVKVNQRGRGGATMLMVALRQLRKSPQELGPLRALVKAGVDPNLAADGELPLEVAIQESSKAGIEPVELLLRAGANPNTKGQFGTPVYFQGAGKMVPLEILDLLLKNGADLKARGKDGREDVLMYAALPGNWKAVKLLIERGADASSAEFRERLKPIPGASAEENAALEDVKRMLALGK